MSDIAIKVEGLGKQYKIGGPVEKYKTFRDKISGLFSPVKKHATETIWALKNVSFEIKQGEVVGVIGRNGAGKSTLLKILSRITEPTEGSVEIHGRVASLLEVGTGFHAELTGRENIYLNAAILGMKRREIEKKFDEMVAFAEVEKFIDTPVKHYSSGMYMRLAFSVAAHLDPDILLVDEVLAVGDAAFQKKCLGIMGEVSRSGRTVILVSHNMATVSRISSMAMWLQNGSMKSFGNQQAVIDEYLSDSVSQTGELFWGGAANPHGDEYVQLREIKILNEDYSKVLSLHQDQSFVIRLAYQVLKPMPNANVGFSLKTVDGIVVFATYDADSPEMAGQGREAGRYESECLIPGNLLNEGIYFLTLEAGIPFLRLCFRSEDLLRIHIHGPIQKSGAVGRNDMKRAGIILPDLKWQTKRINSYEKNS